MSGSSRSRPKSRLEPISLDELAGTTGMSGFGTLFTRDLSQHVAVLDHLDLVKYSKKSALDSSALDSFCNEPIPRAEISRQQDDSSALGSSALDSLCNRPIPTPEISQQQGGSSALVSSALDSERSALESGLIAAPETNTFPGKPETSGLPISAAAVQHTPGYRRPKIRRTVTVQDGHSLAEQAVYDAMYRAGKPYQRENRVLTIGLRTLAEKARMAYANCKANVHSLIHKLAVEDHGGGFSYTAGRTYIIYSYGEILKRRREAGLTHVIRTRGVAFVDPETGIRLDGPSALDSEKSAPVPSKTSALENRESSALAPSAHIRSKAFSKEEKQQRYPSVDPLIVQELRKYSPVSDAAAADLVDLCKAVCPDLTAEEISLMIQQKMASTKVRSSAIGLLRIALPPCFRGESFRQFRQDLARLHEAESRSRAAQKRLDEETAERILQSPIVDTDMREWALEVLAKRAGTAGKE